MRSFYRFFGLRIQQLLFGIGAFVRFSLVFGLKLLRHTGVITAKLLRYAPHIGRGTTLFYSVCAARDPRLCAAVVFQSENQVVVNSGYRAADIFACVDACSRVNR